MEILRAVNQDLLGDLEVRQFLNDFEGDVARGIHALLCLDELEHEVAILDDGDVDWVLLNC